MVISTIKVFCQCYGMLSQSLKKQNSLDLLIFNLSCIRVVSYKIQLVVSYPVLKPVWNTLDKFFSSIYRWARSEKSLVYNLLMLGVIFEPLQLE